VNDDGVDFDRFQKNDVAGDSVANIGVRRVHETAPVFDDERRTAEFLDVRQRFQQRLGFGDEVLHGLIRNKNVAANGSAFVITFLLSLAGNFL
jgi:hypothetical protein